MVRLKVTVCPVISILGGTAVHIALASV